MKQPLMVKLRNSQDCNDKDDNSNRMDLSKTSNVSLIVVTEAPTHNFYSWSSRIYEKFGNVQKMVSTGYHTEDVWFSMIFQMLVGLSVLQEKRIHFHNFSLEDNIYVKDIYSNNEVLGYWKYIIDGIPYYIPNYGYILLVDSNFKDVEPEDVMQAIDQKAPQQHKIISRTIYGDNNNNLNSNSINDNEIKKLCFQDFKNTINPNNFNIRRTQDGLVPPPSKVMRLLSKIFQDNDDDKFIVKNYIPRYMKQFLHNRIGTYLTNSERDNIQNINRPKFIRGELAIQRVKYNTYVWCMYLEEDKTDSNRINRVKILTKNDPSDKEAIEKSVPIGNLKKHVTYEQVKQDYDNNKQNLDEDRLLETYV